MKTAALGIRNLTDARYFAAMNVDWIGFDMSVHSPLTMEYVNAFAEWVEGPKLMLDVRGRTTDEIAGFLSELNADALLVDNNVELSMYNGLTAKMEDSTADITITALLPTSSDGTDKWWLVNSPDQIATLDSAPDITIAVAGGDEDKVGVKNYELLDAIFESLEAIND